MITMLKKSAVLPLRSRVQQASPKMTIAVGMKMKDGIILAADRLLSADNHHFDSEKISFIELNHGFIFFAFADAEITAKDVQEKIQQQLSIQDDWEDGIDLEKIRETVENAINALYSLRLGVLPLQMLIVAAVTGEGAEMWQYDERYGFNRVSDFAVIGVGECALTRYLKIAYSQKDSVSMGADLAIYLLAKAEQFIPKCRGADIISISGNWKWLDDKDVAARRTIMVDREKDHLRKIILG